MTTPIITRGISHGVLEVFGRDLHCTMTIVPCLNFCQISHNLKGPGPRFAKGEISRSTADHSSIESEAKICPPDGHS